MPPVSERVADLRGRLAEQRGSVVLGLVPTMGALHAGHGRLIEYAKRDCGFVVVTIFVNPLQFDRPEELDRYPRTLAEDLRFCDRAGVDLVFAPTPDEMYPTAPACRVHVQKLADHLCGRYRPGHFDGVATVVTKLFNIVEADRAYFGEKDAQQLAIIRRLSRDLNISTTIVGVPTVREPDGLALSSRNQHLSAAERTLAVALYQALCEAHGQLMAGVRDVGLIKEAAGSRIPGVPELRLEYLEIVDSEEMQPVDEVKGPVCVAGALWVGTTRLIDNIEWNP